MGDMSIRKLPDSVHNALRSRAARNKRSTEAEVRAILIDAIAADQTGGLGQQLRACFEDVTGDELDIVRDKTPATPIDLS